MKHACSNPDYLKGEWLVVFDDRAWTRNGGDKGNNGEFYKAAQVVECYWENGDQLIDVTFIGTKRISKGHFLKGASSLTPYWREKVYG